MASNLSNSELDERILQNPDPNDVSLYLVYGDWLSERGDPRGELIAVQAKLHASSTRGKERLSSRRRAVRTAAPLELDYGNTNLSKVTIDPVLKELEAREAKLLLDNASDWLGPLADVESKEDLTFAWRLGFLDAVRLGPPVVDYSSSEIDFDETYRLLMTEVPHTAFLREVVMSSQSADDYPASWQNAIDVIADAGVPRSLAMLVFDCGGYWDISSTELGDLTKAYARLKRLRELRVRMGSMSFGATMDLPELRSLEIITGGLSSDNIKAIVESKWPKLERLSVCIGATDNDYGCDVRMEHLTPIFEAQNLEHVRHLGLCNTNLADEIAAELAQSKILAQLQTLDLSQGTFGDEGARAIIDNAARFKHLVEIDLTHHYTSPSLQAELSKIGPRILLGDAESADDPDDRYVQISE